MSSGSLQITRLGTIVLGVWNGTAIDLANYATGSLPAASFPALTGDVTTAGGALATTIANSAVTYAKIQNVSATSKFLGRITAGAGVIEELSVANAKTLLALAYTDISGLATVAHTGAYADVTGTPSLAAIATSGSADDLAGGHVPAARMPALTGDVTTSAGAVATTIANSAVTYAKMQNVSATSKFLGRITAGAGVVEELSVANAKTLLALAYTDISGLATVAHTGAYSDLSGTPTIPTGANPSASAGMAAVNGSAATFMRSDGAPAISASITPTWTGLHTFNGGVVLGDPGNIVALTMTGHTGQNLMAWTPGDGGSGNIDSNGCLTVAGKDSTGVTGYIGLVAFKLGSSRSGLSFVNTITTGTNNLTLFRFYDWDGAATSSNCQIYVSDHSYATAAGITKDSIVINAGRTAGALYISTGGATVHGQIDSAGLVKFWEGTVNVATAALMNNCTYESGSFTATLTGCTTSPTTTVNWYRVGTIIVLYMTANLSATSNATTMTITGIPAGIAPATAQRMCAMMENNGVWEIGTLTMGAAGTVLTAVRGTNAAFTNSGTKAIANFTISYPLT